MLGFATAAKPAGRKHNNRQTPKNIIHGFLGKRISEEYPGHPTFPAPVSGGECVCSDAGRRLGPEVYAGGFTIAGVIARRYRVPATSLTRPSLTQVKDAWSEAGNSKGMSTTKAFLGIAVTTLILGFVLNAGWLGPLPWDALYTILPVGAVFFGLFLIAKGLEKESQAYDLEQKQRVGASPHGTKH